MCDMKYFLEKNKCPKEKESEEREDSFARSRQEQVRLLRTQRWRLTAEGRRTMRFLFSLDWSPHHVAFSVGGALYVYECVLRHSENA